MTTLHRELNLDPARSYVQAHDGTWLAIPDDVAHGYAIHLAQLLIEHLNGSLSADELTTATQAVTQRIRAELTDDAAGIADAVDAALMAGAL